MLMDLLCSGKKKSKEDAQSAEFELEVLNKICPHLEAANPARTAELTSEEVASVANLNLLTMKPMIYAANINENDIADGGSSNPHVQVGPIKYYACIRCSGQHSDLLCSPAQKLRAYADSENAEVVIVSAKVEAELSELGPEEAKEFLQDLGASESGLNGLVRATYKLLGLKTFFTTGD